MLRENPRCHRKTPDKQDPAEIRTRAFTLGGNRGIKYRLDNRRRFIVFLKWRNSCDVSLSSSCSALTVEPQKSKQMSNVPFNCQLTFT